jgi:hypothetical protein
METQLVVGPLHISSMLAHPDKRNAQLPEQA